MGWTATVIEDEEDQEEEEEGLDMEGYAKV